MFNAQDIQKWQLDLKDGDVIDYQYKGRQIELVNIDFPYATKTEEYLGKYRIGTLFPPDKIFGTPEDASCLNGVINKQIIAPKPQIYNFRNARIIGNAALLTEDNRLMAPLDVRDDGKSLFIERNRLGHQGYLFRDRVGFVEVAFLKTTDREISQKRAIFFPNIEPGNFGSFIIRVLPQLFKLRDLAIDIDCYVIAERTQFFMEAMRLLQLPSKPVYEVREVSGSIFKEITLIYLDDAEGFLSPWYLNKIRIFVKTIADKGSNLEFTKKIYVSRGLVSQKKPWYRVLQNENDVEDIVKSRGFTVIHPECYSIENQMKLFFGAEIVFGTSGSGMFNIIFSENPKKIVDIESYHVTVRQHAKFYSSLGAEYSFLFSQFSGDASQLPLVRSSVCNLNLVYDALDWLTG